jgi:multisubunit Na+/H+ antiporter MnhC subunit
MAFALIRPESRPLIDAARTQDARPMDADRAAAVLRTDFERWSRWGLGLLGFALAIGGAFVTAGMIEAVRMLGGSLAPVDLAVIVTAVIVALAGLAVLVALWWSGRRILSAASWWHRLPYTTGGRQRRAGGWLRARTANFEPRVFVRLVSATLALLVAVGGIALFVRDLGAGVTSMTAASAAVGVIALAAGLGQVGGVMHLVSGLSEADPLWVRIRSVFVRR